MSPFFVLHKKRIPFFVLHKKKQSILYLCSTLELPLLTPSVVLFPRCAQCEDATARKKRFIEHKLIKRGINFYANSSALLAH